jgi:hypothetical protein
MIYRDIFAQDFSRENLPESSAWSEVAWFLMQTGKWLPGPDMS